MQQRWLNVKKEIVCKDCGRVGHYAMSCPYTARKPIAKKSTKVKLVKEKPKTITRAKAKKEAWNAFSTYIRTRDCIRFTGDPTQGMCVTCNRPYPFKKLQAGHFISGRGNAVLFDERLVFSQCVGCNGNPPYGKGGNYVEYFRFMLDEVGLEKIDEFRHLKNTDKVYKTYDFVDIKIKYELKTKELLDKVSNY